MSGRKSGHSAGKHSDCVEYLSLFEVLIEVVRPALSAVVAAVFLPCSAHVGKREASGSFQNFSRVEKKGMEKTRVS